MFLAVPYLKNKLLICHDEELHTLLILKKKKKKKKNHQKLDTINIFSKKKKIHLQYIGLFHYQRFQTRFWNRPHA